MSTKWYRKFWNYIRGKSDKKKAEIIIEQKVAKKEVNKTIIMPKVAKKKVVKKVAEKKVVQTIIDTDFFREKNRKITHCVMHHSTTTDNPQTRNWEAIDIYHRSFRMNWTIMVRPITDFLVMRKILEGLEKNAIKINESYYYLDKVLAFYKKAGALVGEELYTGQYVSVYVKNTKIETPWRKIGYNFGVEKANNKLCLAYGRTLMERGAHCYQQEMNDHSIGWLIIGNYDKACPDSELWKFCIKVGKEIRKEFPGIKFIGHREVKGVTKSCPGKLWDMKQFRKDLQRKR